MKSHRTDKVSLTFAVIFLVIAGWWLLAQTLDLTLPAVGWFVAGGLILFGLLGVFGALRSAHSDTNHSDEVPEAPPVATGSPVVSAPPISSVPPSVSGPPAADQRGMGE